MAETESVSETETEAESETETETETEAETEADTVAESESGTESESVAETVSETESETESVSLSVSSGLLCSRTGRRQSMAGLERLRRSTPRSWFVGLVLAGCQAASAGEVGPVVDAGVEGGARDAFTAPQVCADSLHTVHLGEITGGPANAQARLAVIEVSGVLWSVLVQEDPVDARVLVWRAPPGGPAVRMEDRTLGRRMFFGGLRGWAGGWSAVLGDDGVVARMRFDGTAISFDSLEVGDAGVFLSSTATADYLVHLDGEGRRSGVVRAWDAGEARLREVERFDWGAAALPQGATVGADGYLAVGASVSPRGPWRGTIRRWNGGGEWASVVDELILADSDPSPFMFGRVGEIDMLLTTEGELHALGLPGAPIVAAFPLPHIAQAAIGPDLALGVGLYEQSPVYLDGSEVRFDLPLFFWTIEPSLALRGGQRPILTGRCVLAAATALSSGGYAVVHDCLGSSTLSITTLCRGPW